MFALQHACISVGNKTPASKFWAKGQQGSAAGSPQCCEWDSLPWSSLVDDLVEEKKEKKKFHNVLLFHFFFCVFNVQGSQRGNGEIGRGGGNMWKNDSRNLNFFWSLFLRSLPSSCTRLCFLVSLLPPSKEVKVVMLEGDASNTGITKWFWLEPRGKGNKTLFPALN